MTLDERLKAQNAITTWRACRRHRWFVRLIVTARGELVHSPMQRELPAPHPGDHVYWGCRRCPVDVMTYGEVPR